MDSVQLLAFFRTEDPLLLRLTLLTSNRKLVELRNKRLEALLLFGEDGFAAELRALPKTCSLLPNAFHVTAGQEVQRSLYVLFL